MSVITDILSAPFQGILEGVSGLIGRFVKDPNEQAQAQLQLAQLSTQTQVALVQADQQFAASQAAVIQAEEKEGWLAANWRPITMLVFTYVIFHNYVLDPIFHVGSVPIPPDMWALLKIGMGGYIMGRSVEKFLPDTAGAVASALNPPSKKP